MCLVFALCCFACAGKPDENPEPSVPDEPTPITPVTVSLDRERATVDLFDTLTLTAEVEGSEESTGWLSSDVRVATVTDGVVTAVGVGSATVTAYVGNSLAACEINVVNSFTAPVLDVENSVSVDKGGSYVSPVTILWKGRPVSGAEYSVRLGSGEGVASVAKIAEGLRFTGLDDGDAVFTVTSFVYGYTLVENIAVSVKNSNVTVVMGNGFAPVKGGFVANVSLHPTVGESEIPLEYSVFDNGKESNAVLLWKAGNENIAKISGGKITAVTEGKTEITTSIGGNEITIFVNVYRPEIKAAKCVYVETLNHTAAKAAFAPSERIEGEIEQVIFGNTTLSGVEYGSGMLSYDTAALPIALSAMREGELRIETDKASYVYDARLVTQVIDNFDELIEFGTVAKAMYNDGGYNAGGYFILGGDIDCGGRKYTSTLPSNPQMSGETSWNPYKFHGTFDGNGYNIEDFRPDANGLIPLAGKDAFVKNLSFTNVVVEGNSGRSAILMYAGQNNLENLYIHVKKFAHAADRDCIIATGGDWNTTIKNVFIEVDEVVGEKDATFGVINASGTVTNLYAIGLGDGKIRLGQDKGDKDLYDKFDSRADMAAAGVANAFTDPFWTNVSGVPYPKNLLN